MVLALAPKIANMESMRNEKIYQTTVTTLRPGHSTETHVLKVWKCDRDINGVTSLLDKTPYKVHISKDYGYILKMERGYLAQKITPIFP